MNWRFTLNKEKEKKVIRLSIRIFLLHHAMVEGQRERQEWRWGDSGLALIS